MLAAHPVLVALASELAGQDVQLLTRISLTSRLILPAGQSVQLLAGVLEYVPAGQDTQLLGGGLEYVPGEHARQVELTVAPDAVEYFPSEQARQASSLMAWLAVVEYFPATQRVQDVAPLEEAYFPIVQAMQVPELLAPLVLEYFP